MQIPEEFGEVWPDGVQGGVMPGWYMMPYPWQMDSAHSSRSRGQIHGQQPKQKHRFCATWPSVARCRHGANCAFAHSREEITAPLLTEEEESYEASAMTHDFFIHRFKTLWCPIGAQHDWQACMYAHTYQDSRRPPEIGYGHQLCPFWNKKDTSLAYAQRCPLGPRCPHAHGAKEQLYHPQYFKTLVCRDLQRGKCPRGDLCAFFHKPNEARKVSADPIDYSVPLPKENLPADWLNSFLNPPRFQEAAGEEGDFGGEMAMVPPQPFLPMMAPMCGKWPGGFEEEEEIGLPVTASPDDFEDSPGHDLPAAGRRAARAALEAGEAGLWNPQEAAAWAQMSFEGYDGMLHGYPGSYADVSAGYAWS